MVNTTKTIFLIFKNCFCFSVENIVYTWHIINIYVRNQQTKQSLMNVAIKKKINRSFYF